ncbi:DDE-type integrase/transposase/recombinase [Bacillus thuringiensis]
MSRGLPLSFCCTIIYNNEVVSWKISKRNDNELVLDTLEMLAQKRDLRGTILHSDQGFQYTSHAYTNDF